MSAAEKSASGATNSGPKFTERELQLLGWAMQSLKAGPPDVSLPRLHIFHFDRSCLQIDYDKLAGFAGMTNSRSANNAWAKLKAKLMPPADGSAPATPVKGSAKKKTPAKGKGETPSKTPAKRAAKKQDVDGEGSPKKKGRGKKVAADEGKLQTFIFIPWNPEEAESESEANLEGAQDSEKPKAVPVKAEPKEDSDEDAEDAEV